MTHCPHRPACDGCPLFEQSRDDATAHKLGVIAEAFDAYPLLAELTPSELFCGRDLHYRNRARMTVHNGSPGFYVAGSREHLAIETCAVHAPEIEEMLATLRPYLRASPLREAVVYLDARAGSERVLTFVVRTNDDAVRGAVSAVATQLPDWGLSIAKHDGSGSVVSQTPDVLVPPASALMKAGDMALEAPPRAFYQVNDEVLAAIHGAMGDMLGEYDVLVDAYCGVGTHGLVLGEGRRVVGFDSSPDAVDAANRNAERNGRDAQFELVQDDDLGDWSWPEGPSATIANPARAGLSHQLVRAVANSSTEQLLYLSCEPQTLARDLGRLARRGLVARQARAFDMMPRTTQIETLVVLERAPVPQRIYEAAYDDDKQLPPGVSGPLNAGKAKSTVWFARLAGRVPHGQAPAKGGNATIEVKRLRNIGDQSVAKITMQGGDAAELMRRLRAWGHPVVGDQENGFSNVNAMMARTEWADRPLLHAVSATTGKSTNGAPVPPELLTYFKLPPHKLTV